MGFKFPWEEDPEIQAEVKKRKELVEEARGLSTKEFLARAIHNLHNCGEVYFGARLDKEGRLFMSYWKDTDRVYDAQQRYTMAPEAIVRLWASHLKEQIKDVNSLRTSFSTSCPICNADIRDIFNEFTR